MFCEHAAVTEQTAAIATHLMDRPATEHDMFQGALSALLQSNRSPYRQIPGPRKRSLVLSTNTCNHILWIHRYTQLATYVQCLDQQRRVGLYTSVETCILARG
jgi:hypothetical protein